MYRTCFSVYSALILCGYIFSVQQANYLVLTLSVAKVMFILNGVA